MRWVWEGNSAQRVQKLRPAVPSVMNQQRCMIGIVCTTHTLIPYDRWSTYCSYSSKWSPKVKCQVYLPIDLYGHSADLCIVDFANGSLKLAHFRYTLLSSIKIELSECKLFDKSKKNNKKKKNKNNSRFGSSLVLYLSGVFSTCWGFSYLCHLSGEIGRPL